jgi:hypothetical protein
MTDDGVLYRQTISSYQDKLAAMKAERDAALAELERCARMGLKVCNQRDAYKAQLPVAADAFLDRAHSGYRDGRSATNHCATTHRIGFAITSGRLNNVAVAPMQHRCRHRCAWYEIPLRPNVPAGTHKNIRLN